MALKIWAGQQLTTSALFQPRGLALNSKCTRAIQWAKKGIIAPSYRVSGGGPCRGLTPCSVSGDGWRVIMGKEGRLGDGDIKETHGMHNRETTPEKSS